MYLIEMIGRGLASYLVAPSNREVRPATCRPELLASTLRKGDVLLVEGSNRISTAIKYLTQSTWTHAALYVAEGVRRVPLSDYWNLHTRICRPVGLSAPEIDKVVDYALSRIGHQYDLKNIADLARYLIQTPPGPVRWRRRLLALGSGDPAKAICSSLIAQAFQSVSYPILPESVLAKSDDPSCQECYDEILHIRHHSLFAPRDFDISPYFKIIKPSVKKGFDPHNLIWTDSKEIVEVEEAIAD